jgi:hypothetical protein
MRVCPSWVLLSCQVSLSFGPPRLMLAEVLVFSPNRARTRRRPRFVVAGRVRPGRLVLKSRADFLQIQYRSTSGVRGSGGCVDDFASLVITAVWASLMRLLHLMAVRTFGERRRFQVVVRAPLVLAPMRMTTFRIRHTNSFAGPVGDGSILCRFSAG